MSAFEENLWRDVMREYGGELARFERPDRGRARRARPRLVVGTTAATAVVGVALALLLSGTASPPAFAITGRPDGSVTVIASKQLSVTAAQIARFNRALAAVGARTGRTERLVATASGVEVRCPGPAGQLVRARVRTLAALPSAGATSAFSRGPVTVIAWRCAGPTPNSGAGASHDRAMTSGASSR